MTRILAIDTSSAWCSVALSLDEATPLVRHQKVSAGASQLLLPWVEELLSDSAAELTSLDAIAIGVGPGAFTGVRLGVAVVQGLATAAKLPVLPVASLDAIAAQLALKPLFIASGVQTFVVAVDARMGEIYWAKYEFNSSTSLPLRIGNIQLSKPEEIDLRNIQYLAGSAIKEFGERLFVNHSFPSEALDPEISISALGILELAQQMFKAGQQISVNQLEPLYVRNKVAFTTNEREIAFKKGTP